MVLLAPVYKVLDKLIVGSVFPIPDEAALAELSENFCRWWWGDWWEMSAVCRVNRKGARTPNMVSCDAHCRGDRKGRGGVKSLGCSV